MLANHVRLGQHGLQLLVLLELGVKVVHVHQLLNRLPVVRVQIRKQLAFGNVVQQFFGLLLPNFFEVGSLLQLCLPLHFPRVELVLSLSSCSSYFLGDKSLWVEFARVYGR